MRCASQISRCVLTLTHKINTQVRTHFTDVLIWADLASIVPFYVNLVAGQSIAPDTRWLRILRLSRLLQTLRLERLKNLAPVVSISRYVPAFASALCITKCWQVFEVFESSAGALLAPLFFLSIALTVFSSITYSIERTVSFQWCAFVACCGLKCAIFFCFSCIKKGLMYGRVAASFQMAK